MDYVVVNGVGRVCVYSGVVYDGFNFGGCFVNYLFGKKIIDEIIVRGFVNVLFLFVFEILGMV